MDELQFVEVTAFFREDLPLFDYYDSSCSDPMNKADLIKVSTSKQLNGIAIASNRG